MTSGTPGFGFRRLVLFLANGDVLKGWPSRLFRRLSIGLGRKSGFVNFLEIGRKSPKTAGSSIP